MQQTKANPNDILVWLGPAIGANAFEVGNEVLDKFMEFAYTQEQDLTYQSFKTINNTSTNLDKKCADLYNLAKIRLKRLDILSQNISGGDFCTYFDHRFYSYRRNNITGRIASVIAKIV
jgi:copper oxidase (laccase) domain-containing protein